RNWAPGVRFSRRGARGRADIIEPMSRRALSLALLLVLALSAGRAEPEAVEPAGVPPETAAALDAAARDAVKAGEIPGAVVLVGRGDQVLYRVATGSSALVPVIEPMTVDTIFDVASLTKVLATAPAVLSLWEQGRGGPDAPPRGYLQGFSGSAFPAGTLRRLPTPPAGPGPL